jgi:hypothetical protein
MIAMEKQRPLKCCFAFVSVGLLLAAGCSKPYELAPVHGRRLTTYEKDDGAVVGEHWALVINHEEEVPDGVPEFIRVTLPNKLTVESGKDNEIDLKFTREQVRKYRVDD